VWTSHLSTTIHFRRSRAAGATADAGQKKVFLELAAMEKGHKARLEEIYTTMAFPELW
jgi:rubrerythrin